MLALHFYHEAFILKIARWGDRNNDNNVRIARLAGRLSEFSADGAAFLRQVLKTVSGGRYKPSYTPLDKPHDQLPVDPNHTTSCTSTPKLIIGPRLFQGLNQIQFLFPMRSSKHSLKSSLHTSPL